MLLSGPTALLAFLAALCWALLCSERGARCVRGRLRTGLLGLLVAAAFVAHTNGLRWQPPGRLSFEAPLPHVHEIYHYYLGSKYFDELGYGALYEATVVADAQDAPAYFSPAAVIRDLWSNRLEVRRGDVLARAGPIEARFSAGRWRAFKHDLSVLRGWTDSEYWHTSGFLVDHGYNGTPLVTALLGGLANSGLLPVEGFAGLLRWLDPYLLVLLAAVLMGIEGPLVGLGLLFFAFANPLHEYGFVGGAYLRTDYLLPLVGAVFALRKGWYASCGVLLALSGWLRIFPLLLAVVIGAHDLLQRDFRTRLRSRARFYVAFVVSSLAILAATSLLVAGDDARNPWLAFAANIRAHAGELAVNRIGVPTLVLHAQPPPAADAAVAGRTRADWERETMQTFSRRRGVALAGAAILGMAALALARRAAPALLPIPWMLLVFAAQPLSHYYWALLAVVPVLAGEDRRWHRLGAATLAVLALTASPALPLEAVELRFALYSAEVLVFLIAASWLALRSDATAS